VASKKQRRRREKLQRHEYEYVLETDEGEEVLERPREAEAAPPRNGKPAKDAMGPLDRHGNPVPKPSFRRVLRRTAIFAPLMAIVIYLLVKDDAQNVLATVAFQTLLLLAFFMPFSYVVDSFVYRMLWRRYEKERGARRRR
jgi:hypothetical protein